MPNARQPRPGPRLQPANDFLLIIIIIGQNILKLRQTNLQFKIGIRKEHL